MEEHSKTKDKFGTRLLKGLRGLAYVILAIMVIAVFYSGSLQIQSGDSQTSTVTCSNGQSYSFASIGINASYYSSYTTQLYQSDNLKINNACGTNGGATYSLGYSTHPSDPNAFGTAAMVFVIGLVVIEVIYRFLAYVGGVRA